MPMASRMKEATEIRWHRREIKTASSLLAADEAFSALISGGFHRHLVAITRRAWRIRLRDIAYRADCVGPACQLHRAL